MEDIKTKFSKYLQNFSGFYTASITRRIPIGIISGVVVFLSFVALTYLLQLVLWDSPFNQSFLNDFPLIGLICSFIVSLEVFGLIPHPPFEISDATEIVENSENE